MYWVDIVVLVNVATMALIVGLLVSSIRGPYSEAHRIAFPGILIFQFGWSLTDTTSAVLAVRFNYVSNSIGIASGLCVLGIALSTYLFCEFFATRSDAWYSARKLRVSFASVGTIVCALMTFSDQFIKSRRVENGIRHGDYGPFFIIAGAWVVFLVVAGIVLLLLRSFKITEKRTRTQIRMMALGSALNLLLAFLFSYVLPLNGIYNLDFAGPPSSVVFVSVVLYTILFHRFANLKETYSLFGVHFTLVCIGAISLSILAAALFRQPESNLPLSLILTACLVFGIGIGYQKLIVPIVNRLLVEPALDVTHTLVEIFATSRSGLNRDAALKGWLEDVVARLRIRGASLILKTDAGTIQIATEESAGDLRIQIGRFIGRKMPRALMLQLDTVLSTEESGPPFGIRFQKRYTTLSRTARKFLTEASHAGYSVAVPLFRMVRLDAVLLLGPRLSGELYYEKDLKVLSMLRYALASAVQRVVEQAELSDSKERAENVASRLSQFLFQTRKIDIDPQRQLVYRSEQMAAVVEKARLFASQPHSVLILGETGTGKELIARMIHTQGPNQSRPFVAINCAAMPPHLWEDEMFGHVRGAFTDARENREGKLLEAADGTLFLDEVGELPLQMQAKLLRVLQERTFNPLGSDKNKTVRCRFLFATNRDLQLMIRNKEFRPDLFYRISVLEVSIPPLRDRLSDVPVIAAHLMDDLSRQDGIVGKSLSSDALQHLIHYDWPGNIRELQNVIVRAATTASSPQINREDLVLPIAEGRTGITRTNLAAVDYKKAVDAFRKDLITRALSDAAGNKTRAADALGIKRTTLNSQLKELGI